MSSNAALGKSVLKDWYDTAKAYPTNFNMPFEDFVSYMLSLTNNTFLDNFGDAVYNASKNVGIEVIRQNMRDLATSTQGLVETFPDGAPMSRYWFDSVVAVSEASLTNLNFVKKIAPEVIADTASQVTNLALGGAALYLLGAGLALGLAFYLTQRRPA